MTPQVGRVLDGISVDMAYHNLRTLPEEIRREQQVFDELASRWRALGSFVNDYQNCERHAWMLERAATK